MLKLVKSVADLPYVTYLLAYAPDILDRALADIAPGGGPRYLEKIVQAAFPLPTVERASPGA
jgi:predicted KAP-like P-loop ATPase